MFFFESRCVLGSIGGTGEKAPASDPMGPGGRYVDEDEDEAGEVGEPRLPRRPSLSARYAW